MFHKSVFAALLILCLLTTSLAQDKWYGGWMSSSTLLSCCGFSTIDITGSGLTLTANVKYNSASGCGTYSGSKATITFTLPSTDALTATTTSTIAGKLTNSNINLGPSGVLSYVVSADCYYAYTKHAGKIFGGLFAGMMVVFGLLF